jgi:hypothetical protein
MPRLPLMSDRQDSQVAGVLPPLAMPAWYTQHGTGGIWVSCLPWCSTTSESVPLNASHGFPSVPVPAAAWPAASTVAARPVAAAMRVMERALRNEVSPRDCRPSAPPRGDAADCAVTLSR